MHWRSSKQFKPFREAVPKICGNWFSIYQKKVSTASQDQLSTWLNDGTAWEKFLAMVDLQGGDTSILENFETVHPANCIRKIRADQSGEVIKVDAEAVGRASLSLGAGRATASDNVRFLSGL